LTDTLLETPTYSVSAKVLTDAAITFIRADELRRHLEGSPSATWKFLRKVGAQFQAIEKQQRLQRANTTVRVAHALLELAQSAALKPTDEVVLPIKVKRSLLAELAGTTPETVSRVMGQFRKNRLVRQENQLITISDMQRLRDLVRQGTDQRI